MASTYTLNVDCWTWTQFICMYKVRPFELVEQLYHKYYEGLHTHTHNTQNTHTQHIHNTHTTHTIHIHNTTHTTHIHTQHIHTTHTTHIHNTTHTHTQHTHNTHTQHNTHTTYTTHKTHTKHKHNTHNTHTQYTYTTQHTHTTHTHKTHTQHTQKNMNMAQFSLRTSTQNSFKIQSSLKKFLKHTVNLLLTNTNYFITSTVHKRQFLLIHLQSKCSEISKSLFLIQFDFCSKLKTVRSK